MILDLHYNQRSTNFVRFSVKMSVIDFIYILQEFSMFTTTTIGPFGSQRDNDKEETFECHERIAEYNELRTQARFWLEGILLLLVGIFGIFGNVISILVLPRCPGNRNFNVLLM